MAKLTQTRLREWVEGAARGARLVYGHGHHASEIVTEEVSEALHRLAEQGFVHLFQGPRDHAGRDYIVERSSRRMAA